MSARPYYLEDVATEFHVQGLEPDRACVTWDGDLRLSDGFTPGNSFRLSEAITNKELPAQSLPRAAYPGTAGHGDRSAGRQCGRSHPQKGEASRTPTFKGCNLLIDQKVGARLGSKIAVSW